MTIHDLITDDAPRKPTSAETERDLALVAKAIASGAVPITRCPPHTFTPPKKKSGGWRDKKQTKATRMRARRKAVQQAAKSG